MKNLQVFEQLKQELELNCIDAAELPGILKNVNNFRMEISGKAYFERALETQRCLFQFENIKDHDVLINNSKLGDFFYLQDFVSPLLR